MNARSSSLRRACAASALAVVAALNGCAGGRAVIHADGAGVPVSLSQSFFDASGNVVGPDRQETLEHFAISLSRWSVLWRIIPLNSRRIDLSADLDRRVAAASGDAVVNLTVTASEDPWWVFTVLVPLLPTHAGITVEGDIVRARGD